MLIGAAHPGATVGDVEANTARRSPPSSRSSSRASRRRRAFQFAEGSTTERLMAYARAVAHFPTAVKEFEWRNGVFHDMSVAAMKEGGRIRSPRTRGC